MTDEYLSKVNELHKKIKETTKMINDLQSCYINTIKAINYRGEREDSSCIAFSQGDELHSVILNYYKNHLEKLRKDFENL